MNKSKAVSELAAIATAIATATAVAKGIAMDVLYHNG